jgi:hypothetical protein
MHSTSLLSPRSKREHELRRQEILKRELEVKDLSLSFPSSFLPCCLFSFEHLTASAEPCMLLGTKGGTARRPGSLPACRRGWHARLAAGSHCARGVDTEYSFHFQPRTSNRLFHRRTYQKHEIVFRARASLPATRSPSVSVSIYQSSLSIAACCRPLLRRDVDTNLECQRIRLKRSGSALWRIGLGRSGSTRRSRCRARKRSLGT